MRQTHIGGEKVFVDFAGDTINIFDPITGEVRAMKLFVAAMGASNYTYAEACPTESLSDWIGVHTSCSGISAVCRSSWSAIISRPP
jgi:transposase